MNYRLLFFSFCLAATVFSCKDNAQREVTQEQASEQRPAAKLVINRNVDLGEFDANSIEKSVTLELRNAGDDTLYILAVRPDCDCVKVAAADSVVAPGGSTTIDASLNMDDYLIGDTIEKQFVITSNSVNERHIRVSLVGLLK